MAERRLLGRHLAGVILAFALLCQAQADTPTSVIIGTPPQPEWSGLTQTQKDVLQPLAKDWDSMEAVRRKTWLAIADRYHRMDPPEQGRVQQRMRDWVRLTPEQRAKARGNYRELKQLSTEQKQLIKQKWSAYKQLSNEEKQAIREKHKSSALLAPPAPSPETVEIDGNLPASPDSPK